MALTMLDAANLRIHRRVGVKDPKRVNVVPGRLPAFIEHYDNRERTPDGRLEEHLIY